MAKKSESEMAMTLPEELFVLAVENDEKARLRSWSYGAAIVGELLVRGSLAARTEKVFLGVEKRVYMGTGDLSGVPFIDRALKKVRGASRGRSLTDMIRSMDYDRHSSIQDKILELASAHYPRAFQRHEKRHWYSSVRYEVKDGMLCTAIVKKLQAAPSMGANAHLLTLIAILDHSGLLEKHTGIRWKNRDVKAMCRANEVSSAIYTALRDLRSSSASSSAAIAAAGVGDGGGGC